MNPLSEKIFFLAISLVLHALIVGALFWGDWMRTPTSRSSSVAVTVDLHDVAAPPSTGATTSSSASSNAAAVRESRRTPTDRLTRFFPSDEDRWAAFNRRADSDAAEFNEAFEIAKSGTDSWAYAPDPAFHARFLKTQPGLDARAAEIARRIDDHLTGHPLLAEFDHAGTVYLRFALRDDGSLIGSSLAAAAEDPVLKVRSARAVRAGLAEPLPRALRLPAEHWFTARFLWSSKKNCGALMAHAGPFLTFCRDAGKERPDFSAGGRLASRAKILAGSTGPFGWAEEWKTQRQKEWRHDTGFDPFEADRRDPDADL